MSREQIIKPFAFSTASTPSLSHPGIAHHSAWVFSVHTLRLAAAGLLKRRFAQKQALEDLLGATGMLSLCLSLETLVSLSLCDVLKVVCSMPLWGNKVLGQ